MRPRKILHIGGISTMARGSKTGGSNKRGSRGPAREIQSGQAKVNKTIAGRKGTVRQGSMKRAAKTPGAIKGV